MSISRSVIAFSVYKERSASFRKKVKIVSYRRWTKIYIVEQHITLH